METNVWAVFFSLDIFFFLVGMGGEHQTRKRTEYQLKKEAVKTNDLEQIQYNVVPFTRLWINNKVAKR